MLTFIFLFLLFGVFGKILIFALKACWGITKILLSVVFLPLVLVGLAFSGMITLAIVLCIVIGIISLFTH